MPVTADPGASSGWTRRAVLLTGLALPAGVLVGTPPAFAFEELQVRPRAAWAGDLAPKGPLPVEQRADVRYLLVHHTASTNDYEQDDVVAQLRSFYSFHTGPDKGWPDLAYNFMVDRFGGVWEGRAGSVQQPVMASATGGSQGFAQLACYIGDLSGTPPTPPARASMLRLLAWLAEQYDVDTSPGAEVSFVSRGSNKWPAGSTVVTRTIAGHRDMSSTSCPGDVAYADLRSSYQTEVTALRARAVPAAPVPPPPPPPAPTPAPTPPSQEPSQEPSAVASSVTPAGSEAPSASTTTPGQAAADAADGDDGLDPGWLTGATLGAAVATGTWAAWRHRRTVSRPRRHRGGRRGRRDARLTCRQRPVTKVSTAVTTAAAARSRHADELSVAASSALRMLPDSSSTTGTRDRFSPARSRRCTSPSTAV